MPEAPLWGFWEAWRLYLVVLGVSALTAALAVSVALWRAPEPAPAPRAGVTCMDDAGGGVYCWKGKP